METDYRAEVLALLRAELPPANFRWVLTSHDGLLTLRIENREPWEFTVRGRVLFRYVGAWEAIRSIDAPTYRCLWATLSEWPEFLEYRLTSAP